MSIAATRVLDQHQTETFNVEYVDEALWLKLHPVFASRLDRPSRYLDVGGGNGKFCDLVVDSFPKVIGTNLEPAKNLVSSNLFHPRKTVKPITLQQLDGPALPSYDLISMNWVLHHLVTGSYKDTWQCQKDSLEKLRSMLAKNGKLVVLENVYDGQVFSEIPSRLIYSLTSSRLLKQVVRRAGANTAGIGVCFHSMKAWKKLFSDAGLRITAIHDCYEFGNLSPARRLILHAKTPRVAMFELERAD